MTKIKKLTSAFLAVIMALGVLTVAPFTVGAASYKDEFINALMNNQNSWNTPLFGDGKSMTTMISFMDINFDGKLELVTDYVAGTGGICTEIYGLKNGKIIHYKVDKGQSIVDSFDYYYDLSQNRYRIFVVEPKSCNNYSHKDKLNYELVVIDNNNINNTIFKDYYSSYCPSNRYFIHKRKTNGSNGYTEGDYRYNIIETDKSGYDKCNNDRIKNCEKVNITRKYIGSSDWKNYSYSQKKKALEDSYNAFSYTRYDATSVKLNRSSLTLGVGEKYGLIKTVSPSSANQSCTWSSSNSSIASVDSSGKVTAKKTGAANITVKTSNGKTASCKVIVKPAPTSVKTNPTSVTLGIGETYTISESTNSGTYANAANLKWSTSNSGVATVAKGSANKATITAKGVGTTYIKITLYNGKTATCKVTVKNAPSSVKTSPASVTLGKGETLTICENTNSGSYANAANLKWSTSNSSIATVTKGSGNKAKIIAKGVGTAYIKITLYNGKTAQCKVTVKNAPSSVKVNPTSLTLRRGDTYTISETTNSGAYANAANLKWSTSNSSVATVTKGSGNKAKITAKGVGTAYIKITLYNGKTATCKVNVK